MSDDITLHPTDEEEESSLEKQVDDNQQLIPLLPESLGIPLLNEITDICNIYQSARNLSPTSTITKDTNFYINEIINTLKRYTIIEE